MTRTQGGSSSSYRHSGRSRSSSLSSSSSSRGCPPRPRPCPQWHVDERNLFATTIGRVGLTRRPAEWRHHDCEDTFRPLLRPKFAVDLRAQVVLWTGSRYRQATSSPSLPLYTRSLRTSRKWVTSTCFTRASTSNQYQRQP